MTDDGRLRADGASRAHTREARVAERTRRRLRKTMENMRFSEAEVAAAVESVEVMRRTDGEALAVSFSGPPRLHVFLEAVRVGDYEAAARAMGGVESSGGLLTATIRGNEATPDEEGEMDDAKRLGLEEDATQPQTNGAPSDEPLREEEVTEADRLDDREPEAPSS